MIKRMIHFVFHNVYLIGDNVGALALLDFDGDGENEVSLITTRDTITQLRCNTDNETVTTKFNQLCADGCRIR